MGTDLAGTGIGSNVKLKVKVQGNTYTTYVNGKEYCTYTDTTGTYADAADRPRDWVGLYMYRSGQTFDNLQITAL